jgi:hypothetical protein
MPVVNILSRYSRACGSSSALMVPITDDEVATLKDTKTRQLSAVLTSLYFVIEAGRKQVTKGEKDTIRQAVGMYIMQLTRCRLMCSFAVGLEPKLPQYLVKLIARLRWDDSFTLPISRVCCSALKKRFC